MTLHLHPEDLAWRRYDAETALSGLFYEAFLRDDGTPELTNTTPYESLTEALVPLARGVEELLATGDRAGARTLCIVRGWDERAVVARAAELECVRDWGRAVKEGVR